MREPTKSGAIVLAALALFALAYSIITAASTDLLVFGVVVSASTLAALAFWTAGLFHHLAMWVAAGTSAFGAITAIPTVLIPDEPGWPEALAAGYVATAATGLALLRAELFREKLSSATTTGPPPAAAPSVVVHIAVPAPRAATEAVTESPRTHRHRSQGTVFNSRR
jgi:hypothetical protein